MTEARTSMPACATNHPTEPSVLRLHYVKSAKGLIFPRYVCCTCRSVKALAQPRAGHSFGEKREAVYGVFRLSWTPPEMLMGAS